MTYIRRIRVGRSRQLLQASWLRCCLPGPQPTLTSKTLVWLILLTLNAFSLNFGLHMHISANCFGCHQSFVRLFFFCFHHHTFALHRVHLIIDKHVPLQTALLLSFLATVIQRIIRPNCRSS